MPPADRPGPGRHAADGPSARPAGTPRPPGLPACPDSPPAGRGRLLFAAWVAFAGCSHLALLVVPDLETVAFHLVWISMSVVYGFQAWSPRRTAAVLAAVTLVTGSTLADYARRGHLGWDELAEVPLMALVFLAMVWHVRRRAAALAELRALAERERRAQQDKELFVRTCSHEMRTPLTVARCYAELVRDGLPAEHGREDLDVVLDELDRLGRLAGRLLLLADACRPNELDRGPVELGALVHRTAQRWRPATDRRWQLDAPAVRVDGDESRLEAALDALVENAVKFTSPGDTITLRCRSTRHGAELDVEDTGIGFTDSPAAGLSGTGLGLPIVRAVLDAHHGALTISPAPHGGSLLRMHLPASAGA
ncbi:sensor histidine kinase [Kitasatospora cheerisanensis]|uniref:Sensor-like histidine kinase SenX3 n=1 Tax=Kitasatospora cheerisanensis KCTC 2395 TaxID=1348663 RepID=A0A066Z035_9ACTN|nr:HAMP domain-containing sensor histidine kinase [Kitasatospora cheerisanensis]KDN87143.1 histidine kinase [Kitasatospora cheerisanensis KCTC 2395]